jgi:hypothetical protein
MEPSMERFLGAFEHSFWLYDQVWPVHFSLSAKISGKFSFEQLRQSLVQVQQQHPLLRVCIAVDEAGRPKFVEQRAQIPLRVLPRQDDQQWQRELEVELMQSFDWRTAPLVRVVLLHSETAADLIVTCHHAIADGLSIAYLIRDIVQGLEAEAALVKELSECPAMEQLMTASSNVESSEQNSQPAPEYSTAVATRPRPHLRAALLSADLTQHLRDRCRAEQTSVHGAISAAFLLSLAGQQETWPTQLKCLSPMSMRSQLAVGETVGLYIEFLLTTHQLRADSSLWEVARSLKSQLSEAMLPERLLAATPHRQAVMATCPAAATVAEGMQQRYDYNLLVTNLGRLNLEQQFGSLRIAELYGPAVMTGGEQKQIVGVATLGDRLSVTVSSSSTTTSGLAVSAMLAEAIQLLSDAVQTVDRPITEAKPALSKQAVPSS